MKCFTYANTDAGFLIEVRRDDGTRLWDVFKVGLHPSDGGEFVPYKCLASNLPLGDAIAIMLTEHKEAG